MRRPSAKCSASRTALGRFLSKVEFRGLDECWEWTGTIQSDGYGVYYWSKYDLTKAHRAAYWFWKGDLICGLEIDHLCRNRRCVNPRHLEQVTHAENVRRAFAAKVPITHCKRGHEFVAGSFRVTRTGARACRACDRLRPQRRKYRDK